MRTEMYSSSSGGSGTKVQGVADGDGDGSSMELGNLCDVEGVDGVFRERKERLDRARRLLGGGAGKKEDRPVG